ncbi:CHAT domain-containing protein [Microcoleus sp. T3_A4]|uniref:CHAT domain-containing protein n=1 Tax=Microcoleus sp. T3_A4 TaxID=2818968 RepID=UPI002FD1F2FE
MAKTYYTYRIRVANRDRVQVEKWDAQHQDKGQPSGAFRYQENLAEIAPLLQAAKNNELNDSNLARLLGEALFNVLFDDVLRQDFVNFYYQVVQQEKQLLRVELDIDEQGMPEIAALPWEFMCVPARANLGTIWIGTLPDLVFSRRRSQWIAAQPILLEPDEKLRIALVISAPPNLPPVAYEPVQAALEKLAVEQANRVELLPIVSSANPKAIDTILSRKPHIFHFIGHGRMQNEDKQEVGEIALVDSGLDEVMWVDADYFSELFNRHRPGLIMLQACEGGMLSSSQVFVGVASKLVQQNVPVVVAMQYEVTNSTACCFALEFYQQLATEAPVDIATQDGRRAIALGPTQYRKRDFAIPVIFMRVRDGYLFKHQEAEAESRQPNRQPIDKLFNTNIGQITGSEIQLGDRNYYGVEIERKADAVPGKPQQPTAKDSTRIIQNVQQSGEKNLNFEQANNLNIGEDERF